MGIIPSSGLAKLKKKKSKLPLFFKLLKILMISHIFTLCKLNSGDRKCIRFKGYSIESLLARTGKLFRMLYINFIYDIA